ncbi:hypothetical protein BDFB_014470 [Asbolus verrucosus]|uniref:Uncharacterized protein n=1 Tax=Asbolus verrucosus TaxID=1661398 RepID=A0A482VK72_ASBVE|nr:hypothetical protein BDFB_014470 [Asbolus verrucosus]
MKKFSIKIIKLMY